jgi:hypothetical protein
MSVGFEAFVESITALGKACTLFLLCIEAITPALTVCWFPAVASATLDNFLVKSCRCFELLEEPNFRSLTDGT